MNTRKIIAMLFVVGIFTVLGCKKYEQGGLISKTESNLKRTWVLQKYLRNDVDETSLLLIKNYEETYSDPNSYSRNYIDKDDKFVSENGTWSFEKGEKTLRISGVSSMKVTEKAGSVSSSHYNIVKLDGNEFWYNYINGGDKHEFRLVKK